MKLYGFFVMSPLRLNRFRNIAFLVLAAFLSGMVGDDLHYLAYHANYSGKIGSETISSNSSINDWDSDQLKKQGCIHSNTPNLQEHLSLSPSKVIFSAFTNSEVIIGIDDPLIIDHCRRYHRPRSPPIV